MKIVKNNILDIFLKTQIILPVQFHCYNVIYGMLGNKYSFWWIPKPVATTGRRSIRAQKGTPTEPFRNVTYSNVMYDKRVVRGSNYGPTSMELDTYNKAAEWRRRNILRKKVHMRNQRNVIGTPPPVLGRRHEVIQTDKYLEELFVHPPVRTTDTQTDLFLEPPPAPAPYISKIGVDVGTYIEPQYFDDDNDNDENDGDSNDMQFIDSFIEACFTDTVNELEDIESKPTELTKIVDSHDILKSIIEDIIKEREEAVVEQMIKVSIDSDAAS